MAKHTLKIMRYEHRKIFKVCLAILQHYAWKVNTRSEIWRRFLKGKGFKIRFDSNSSVWMNCEKIIIVGQ